MLSSTKHCNSFLQPNKRKNELDTHQALHTQLDCPTSFPQQAHAVHANPSGALNLVFLWLLTIPPQQGGRLRSGAPGLFPSCTAASTGRTPRPTPAAPEHTQKPQSAPLGAASHRAPGCCSHRSHLISPPTPRSALSPLCSRRHLNSGQPPRSPVSAATLCPWRGGDTSRGSAWVWLGWPKGREKENPQPAPRH